MAMARHLPRRIPSKKKKNMRLRTPDQGLTRTEPSERIFDSLRGSGETPIGCARVHPSNTKKQHHVTSRNKDYSLNPLSESLIPSEARGLHPVGVLACTHRNAVEDEQHASLDRAPVAKMGTPARFLRNLEGGRGLLLRVKVTSTPNLPVET